MAPYAIEQLLSTSNPIRASRQGFKKRELFACQLDFRALTKDMPVSKINSQQIVFESPGRVVLDAPQHGSNAREQLFHGKRLGYVVIGTKLKARDSISLRCLGGKNDDWCSPRLGFSLETSTKVYAAHTGEHQVKYD